MSAQKARLAELKRREDAIPGMPRDTAEQDLAAWLERVAVADGYIDLFRAEMAGRQDYDSVAWMALVWARTEAERMARSAREQADQARQRIARRTEAGGSAGTATL